MSGNIRRRDVLKGIGAAGLAGVAGCVGGDDEETINLGLLMGVTGGLEEVGPPIRDAAELVQEQIEDADVDVELNTQFEDTETDPPTGVSGAEALVDADYNMMVGALASAVSMSVAEDVAIPNGAVMMSPASTAPEYSDLEDDFTFRTAVSDAFQGQALADIAFDDLGAETAATFVQDDAYGQGLATGFVNAFEDGGGTVTEQVVFPEGEQTSFTGELESALSDDPDTIVFVAYPEDGVTIFRDFYSNFEDRAEMPLLVADGLQDPGLPGEVGFDMSNVSGTAPIGEGPGVEFFEDFYEDTYGSSPAGQPFVRQSYDAAAVLALAGAAAGENDGEVIRDEIREVTEGGGEEVTPEDLPEGVEMAADGDDVEYRGVSGEVTFDENGDQDDVAYDYFQYTEDGDVETIEIIEL